jgi:hypothetical protein
MGCNPTVYFGDAPRMACANVLILQVVAGKVKF